MTKRIFLDWSRPCLPQVVEKLLVRGSKTLVDLSKLIIVTPGGRAGRRLIELLVDACDQQNLSLLPPKLMTSGQIADALSGADESTAQKLESVLAWVAALKKFDPEAARQLFLKAESTKDFFNIAEELEALANEVGAANLDFSDISKHCSASGNFNDERWSILAQLEELHEQILSDSGLQTKFKARRAAIDSKVVKNSGEIWLISTTDLNQVTKELLSIVDQQVTTIIHAPESESSNFDQFGCVISETWANRIINIPDKCIKIVEQLGEQGTAVVDALAGLSANSFQAEQITIGVADQTISPYIERALNAQGVNCRIPAGTPLQESPLLRTLSLISQFLKSDEYRDFGTLARDESVLQLLANEHKISVVEILSRLDNFQHTHLPAHPRAVKLIDTDQSRAAKDLIESVSRLILPLKKSLPLNQWPAEIRELVRNIFSSHSLVKNSPDHTLQISALQSLREFLEQLETISQDLYIDLLGSEMLDLAIRQIGSGAAAPTRVENAIEILGVLELHLDDAPVIVITGCNEGNFPESINEDQFLPNRLRTELNILDNQRRYARDAYALSAMLNSKTALFCIASRLDSMGQAHPLSRLLYAGDAAQVASRALSYSKKAATAKLIKATGQSKFILPPPAASSVKKIEEMSVTSFNTYLKSPYEFYLTRVMGLNVLDDLSDELDPLQFGNLLHGVLADFAKSELKNSTNKAQIANFLSSRLAEVASRFFSKETLVAVQIQLEQARERLTRFADWQAAHAKSGWEIVQSEFPLDRTKTFIELPTNNSRMTVTGRIDRIDQHKPSGEFLVIDYKTGESALQLKQIYAKQNGWQDLQLPLYSILLGRMGFAKNPKLAYLCLSADYSTADGDLILELTPSEAELAEAEKFAQNIAEQVQLGNFAYAPDQKLHQEFSRLLPQLSARYDEEEQVSE